MKHEEIEQVTDEMIDLLILEHKYVAVLFYDKLDRMSSKILGELENIDDEAEDKDIVMVKIDIDHNDLGILEKFKVPNALPKLALFEDDQPVQIFEGDLGIEEDALKWLVQATIEEVPVAMNLKKPEPKPKEAPATPTPAKPAPTEPKKEKPKEDVSATRKAVQDPKPKIEEPLEDDETLSEATEAIKTLNEERNVVAFFYEKLDKVATKIIAGLSRVEEHFTGQDIVFLNVDVNDVKDISVTAVPSLVYFKNGEPEPYPGK